MSETYEATAVVHTEEGAVLAPGERTGENFDPGTDFNAELIEEGQLRPSASAPDASEVPEGETPAEVVADAQEPAQSATEKAVELAEAEGVDLADVTGTGDGGKITVDDVRTHLA